MFVKLFTQILDSSIADNRTLRHFFTDLLLCADAKGLVIMTPTAIARRIGATLEEVEWGLAELQKPDPQSKTPDKAGARIERIEGSGYGWRIINYESYRALKDADQMRQKALERMRRFRERQKQSETNCNVTVTPCYSITEAEAEADSSPNRKKPTATTDDDGYSIPQEEWIAEMSRQFPDIDVEGELTKFAKWLQKKGDKPTRRGFVGWLQKASPALNVKVKRGLNDGTCL